MRVGTARGSLCVLATIGFFGLWCAGASAFQGPWTGSVEDLSVVGEPAQGAQVAVAADGTTTVVWRRYDGAHTVVQASTRAPGGTFGTPVDLSEASQHVSGPQIAVAPDGTTAVGWIRTQSGSVTSTVQVRVRPPGGKFGDPVDLSTEGWGEGGPQIVVAPDDAITVAWERYNGTDQIVQASTRAPGGSFSAPTDLSPLDVQFDHFAGGVQLAAAPDGAVTAVWSLSRSFGSVVQASTQEPGGHFGDPVEVSELPFYGYQQAEIPQIAIAADGTATVVWQGSAGGPSPSVVQAATRAPGGSFTAQVDVSVSDRNAQVPQVATAPDGTSTVVWQRWDGANFIAQTSTRPPGGTFSTPLDLSAPGGNARDPQIAVAPDGTATAVWTRSTDAGTIIEASTRAPGGAFGTPVELTARGQPGPSPASGPQIAVGADGAATAVWERFTEFGYTAQAVFTANPPALRLAPAVTGSGAVGSTLGCDGGQWTGAAQVGINWLRGTTAVGTGGSYRVTTDDQGQALSCRATATNPYGSAQSMSSPVTVAWAPSPGAAQDATPPAPVVRSSPRIKGRATVGRVLRCTAATFAGATGVANRWLRGATTIRKARGPSYRPTGRDVGRVLSCRSIATGPGGTTFATSLGVIVRPRRSAARHR